MADFDSFFPALSGGGGSGLIYQSGRLYWQCIAAQFNLTAGMSNNTDYLFPFIPFSDVTVAKLGFIRANATAGDVYIGIYDIDGNLLTDCAVDSTAVAGVHTVSTTPVELTGGQLYYMAINQSAAVVNTDTLALSDPQTESLIARNLWRAGFDLNSGASFPSSSFGDAIPGGIYKYRSNTPFSDPLTISGFTNAYETVASLGIVPQ